MISEMLVSDESDLVELGERVIVEGTVQAIFGWRYVASLFIQ